MHAVAHVGLGQKQGQRDDGVRVHSHGGQAGESVFGGTCYNGTMSVAVLGGVFSGTCTAVQIREMCGRVDDDSALVGLYAGTRVGAEQVAAMLSKMERHKIEYKTPGQIGGQIGGQVCMKSHNFYSIFTQIVLIAQYMVYFVYDV